MDYDFEALEEAADLAGPAHRRLWLDDYAYNPNQQKPCCEKLQCSSRFEDIRVNMTSTEFCNIDLSDPTQLALVIGSSVHYTTHVPVSRRVRTQNAEPSDRRRHSNFRYGIEYKHEPYETCAKFFLYANEIDAHAWTSARRLLADGLRVQPSDSNYAAIDRFGTFYTTACKIQPYMHYRFDFGCMFGELHKASRFLRKINVAGAVRLGAIPKLSKTELMKLCFEGFFFRYVLDMQESQFLWVPLSDEEQAAIPRTPLNPSQFEGSEVRKKRVIDEEIVLELREHIGEIDPYLSTTYGDNVRVISAPNSEGATAVALSGKRTAYVMERMRENALQNDLFFYQPDCTLCYAGDGLYKKWSKHLRPDTLGLLAPSVARHFVLHAAGGYAQTRLNEAEIVLFDMALSNVGTTDIGDCPFSVGTFGLEFGLCDMRLPARVFPRQTLECCAPANRIGVFVCTDSAQPGSGKTSAWLVEDSQAGAVALGVECIDGHMSAIETHLMNFIKQPKISALLSKTPACKTLTLFASTCARMSSLSADRQTRRALRAYFANAVHALMQRVNAKFKPYDRKLCFILSAQMHETTLMHAASGFTPCTMERMLSRSWLLNYRAAADGISLVDMVYENVEQLAALLNRRMNGYTWRVRRRGAVDSHRKLATIGTNVTDAYDLCAAMRILGMTRCFPDAVFELYLKSYEYPFTINTPRTPSETLQISLSLPDFESLKSRWRSLCKFAAIHPPGDEAACFISRAVSSGTCPCDITEAAYIYSTEQMIRPLRSEGAVSYAFRASVYYATSDSAVFRRLRRIEHSEVPSPPPPPQELRMNPFAKPEERRKRLRTEHVFIESRMNNRVPRWIECKRADE
jgi:hypothetical protein